jgi:hypothetical protein
MSNKDVIAVFGVGSIAGMFVTGVALMLAMIWDVEFIVKLSASGAVVFAAVFVAALIASNSPLYRD